MAKKEKKLFEKNRPEDFIQEMKHIKVNLKNSEKISNIN